MSATAKLFSSNALRDVVGSDEVAAIFRHREKLDKVSAYVPPEVKLRIARLAKAWTILSRLDDPKAAAWSESEAAKRLIEISLDMAFKELDIDIEMASKSDEDWATFEAKLLKRAKSNSK
jgi:hypothetical protein